MTNTQRLDIIRLSNDRQKIIILDQTKLPTETAYLEISTLEASYDAIKLLQVRGAPAIGVFAAYAAAVLANQIPYNDKDAFFSAFKQICTMLNSSRPTAVNLSWALQRMMKTAKDNADKPIEVICDRLYREAIAIDHENVDTTTKIAEYGLSLIKDGDGVLTHCNAGYLACMGYGTALAPIYLAHEKGMHIHVYSDETRPLLQGARLTSYELHQAGVEVTSICDNMASIVMKQGKINAVFVGCDRIAANGDFANKIGTSGVAVLAKYYGIPVYSLGPTTTIDMSTPTGADIVIEERDPDEIRSMWYESPMILSEIDCYNPAFDVTDHELLTGIVTEKGIVYPPFDVNLKALFQDE